MNVLLVAPNPFFEERGTPIAVRMLCETLCGAGHSVDLLTYHVGSDVEIAGLNILRIPRLPLIIHVPIGFSWKKIICDIFLSAKLVSRIVRKKYEVVHAVEEAIFPALLAKVFGRAKLIYDMDSSMPDQLLEKWTYLRPISPVLYKLEKLAIRRADGVMAVCEDLAERARADDPQKHVVVLQDVPLDSRPESGPAENLRETCDLHGPFMLYVGNLEHYQGIDLLLEGFAVVRERTEIDLVIIGGTEEDIAKYQDKARALGVLPWTHFLGPRPIARLAAFLEQATILVSPRLSGNNTPMKIYSYLASGRPVVATNIRSHTQVLDPSCAVLVEPTPANLAEGFERLVRDETLHESLGEAAKRLVQAKYSMAEYKKKIIDEYARLERGCSD